MIKIWQQLTKRTQDTLLAILVALVALFPRLAGLDAFLTADEPKSWFGRSIQFLDALARADWAATFDSPAPGVTTMWAGSIGLLLEYARQGFSGGSLTNFLANIPFDPLDPTILPLIRLPIVLVAVLAVALTYLWGRDALGQIGALLAALLLALDPFMLALTRILGHDGLVAIFMWLSLIAFLKAIQLESGVNRRFMVISGILGGLAFLSKYPSLFLGAFIALTLLILYLRRKQPWRQTLKIWVIDVGLWSVAAGVVFILLWPAMWIDPIGKTVIIINDALRASGNPHQKGSFFLGQPVPDPGSGFYPLVTFFRTTPILWLGWLLVLIALVVRRSKDQAQRSWRQVALILLAFAVLYGGLITLGGKKQDRYILPSFPALAALAALGYAQVARLKFTSLSRFYSAKLLYWLLPVVLLIQAALVLPHYPYYFTYYTPILGGGSNAARAMIVGWGEGLDQAARWLNSQPNAENLDVVAWYSTTFEPYFNGHAIYKIEEEKISRTPKPALAADYVILYANQVQRELPSIGALQHFQAVSPAHTVTLHGLDYAWIYPSVKMHRVIADEARLVGQAELLGFNLLDETDQPIQALASDRIATVQLYWEWQGKLPDEPIGLSLVDDIGQIWGWGNPLGTQARFAFEEWGEGMIAHDDFALAILPGTPPGDYYLNVWIDRPATGEVVGVFPIAPNDARLTVERPTAPPPLSDLPLSVQIDTIQTEGIKLLGLDAGQQMAEPWQPNESRNLTLFWQANQLITKNHLITLALVDNNGIIRANWIGQPAGGRFPTDHWQSGDIIRDPWFLTLPPYVPPGDYRVTVRLGEAPPIELLTVSVEGRPRLFDSPVVDIPLNVTFGESIKLLGLQAPTLDESTIGIAPGQSLEFELVWQATDLVKADYTVTVQLLDEQQQIHTQRDSMPLDGTAPTTSWAVGEIVPDTIRLNIPAEVDSNPSKLLIALYRFDTGERLLLPNGADHLTIPVKLQ